MSPLQTVEKLTLCSLALVLCGAGHGASAHSSIMIAGNAVVEEAVTALYRIQHACSESGLPVIAQSFIMPTVNPILSRRDGGKIPDTDGSGAVDLGDVIENGSFVGLIAPFVDTHVFKQSQRKIDVPDLDNTVGFSSTHGKVPDKFYAETPFSLVPVSFVQNSCARELVVHPVGADICRFTSIPDGGDANIWMEHPTKKFPNWVHGVGENQLRITYQRDLSSNPLRKRCGEGHTVDVFASDEDIDAHLPIPGLWPK